MKFYIATSDKTSSVFKYTTYLFNKYWKVEQEFTILGTTTPLNLPDNFKFIKIREDEGIQHWTTDFYEFIKNQQEEHFIFSIDDFLPTNFLQPEMLAILINYVTTHKEVGRATLGKVYDSEVIDTQEGYDILRQKDNALYKISTQTSIWSKEYFLKYTNHHWSPWEFELRGTKRAWGDGFEVVGTNPSAFSWVERGVLSSRWQGINWENVNQVDVDYLKTL
jgi:hypothetical protein